MFDTISRRFFLKLQASLAMWGLGLYGCKGRPIEKIDNTALLKKSDTNSPVVFGLPVVLCGANVDGKANFEVLGDFGVVSGSGEKTIVYISSNKAHYTNIGIHEHGEFSICFPTEQIIAKTDYCGVVSGHKVDKSSVFPVQYGTLINAPLIKECIYCISCRVLRKSEVHAMDVFLGEVVEQYVHPAAITNGEPNIENMKSITFGPGNAYRSISLPKIVH